MFNMGDEEILRVFVRELKPFANKIFVNSSNPKYTEQKFGVDCFSTSLTKDIVKRVKIFITSDIYIFGGGSVLIEHSKRNLRWYHLPARPVYLSFVIVLLGRLLGKKIIFASNGIGPIESIHVKFLTRIILSLAHEIIVRDKYSLRNVQDLTGKRAVLSSDIVLLSKVSKKVIRSNKTIIIFPSYHMPVAENEKMKVTRELVKFINWLSESGLKVKLIPLWYDFTFITDTWYAEFLISQGAEADITVCKSFLEISKYLSSAKFCLSMRLHGAIFSAVMEKPFIALNYNPKVKGFVDEINKNYLIELRNINVKILKERFKKLSFGKRESRNFEALKQKAKITFKILNTYLE